jgi:urea transporter
MDPMTFAESVFKGVGQVMFMGSAITGAFFLIGIAVASRRSAVMAFLGSLTGTLVALAMNAPESTITFGLFGFNGTLTAQALCGVFTRETRANFAYSLGAAGLSSLVLATLVKILSAQGIPTLTAPFVFTTWVFMFASMMYGRIQWHKPSQLPSIKTDTNRAAAEESLKTVLKGVSQVMFMDNWITGLLFCVGLSLGTLHYQQYPNYLAGPVAFIGSLIGAGTALLLKAPEEQIGFGLFGFNAVLAVLAVGGVFITLSPLSLVWALIAAATSSIMTSALMTFLKPYGIPTLTSPFVFTTWIFLFGLKMFTFPS